MISPISDEERPLKEKINQYHKQHLKNEIVKEEERVLKILKDMNNWCYSCGGISNYNIPQNHYYIDVAECPKVVGIELYEKLAKNNGLKIASYNNFTGGKFATYTFICKIECDLL